MWIYPVLYALGAMLQGRANFFMDDTSPYTFLSSIYFPAVSHSHNPHGLGFLIDLVNDTILTNSNTPIVL
jgi:hypothetical protein